MIHVLHVITSLSPVGGAEMMLYKLAAAADHDRVRYSVISLCAGGELAERITATGASVNALGYRRGLLGAASLVPLSRAIGRLTPDVVQTWMYHADLIGGVAAAVSRRTPVVWNVRASELNVKGIQLSTRLVIRSCAAISSVIPERIVCGSEAAKQAHVRLGYDEQRVVVIPNGFDTNTFKPDPAAREAVRAELGVRTDEFVIGLFARFNPLKDHETFLRAAGILVRRCPDARFLLCGAGMTTENESLMQLLADPLLASRVMLLGERRDMARLTAALDVAALSSYSEGFPNVVGEAMACGVSCVVTDVGDAAMIVGDTGRVVPPRQPADLASALELMAGIGPEARRDLGRKARKRIQEHFSIQQTAKTYEDLYLEVAAAKR